MSEDEVISVTTEYTLNDGLSNPTPFIPENKESVTMIWFNPTVDMNGVVEKIKEDLLVTNDFIQSLEDTDLCINYMKSINKEKIFLIISGTNACKLLPSVINLSQLDSVFIFPENREEFHRLLDDFAKIAGIFDNDNDLLKAIKDNIKYVQRQMEVVSFYDKNQHGTRDLSEQSADFLWFQIFNDVIQHLPHDDKAKEEMLVTCRQYYRDNHRILKDIDDFEQNYHIDDCIRWYTRETFIYRLINKALRTEDIEQLYLFRYYITDLSKQLAEECKKIKTGSDEKIYLYRGSAIHRKEAEKLQRNVGRLIAASGYWSTSLNRSSALEFAKKMTHHSEMVPFLFEMECDVNDCNESIIFADISYLSYFETEEEVLFDAGSVFQIEKVSVEESDTKLCIVQLKTTDKGQTLAKKCIEEHRRFIREEGPRIMLSRVLRTMGKFKKSLEFLEYLLKNPGEENIAHIHTRIGVALKGFKQYDRALSHLKTAFQLTFYSTQSDRKYSALVLYNQGRVYAQQGKNKEALSYYPRAISIYEKENDTDDDRLALFYSSLGRSYSYQGEYQFALEYHLKALKVRQELYPANHHMIVWSLYQLGKVYYKMNDLKTALNYYQKSFDMTKMCLEPGGIYFVPRILLDIALVYHDKPSEAIQYQLQALELEKTTEPVDYSNLAFILDTIASTYMALGKTRESIKYYDEALHIRQEHIPNDQFGINRNLDNIASLYEEFGDMASALVFYGKSLKMYEQHFPYHHRFCEKTRRNINRVQRKLK